MGKQFLGFQPRSLDCRVGPTLPGPTMSSQNLRPRADGRFTKVKTGSRP
ncbi:MAG: hypothetical protein F7B17_05580 [Desulfurococcales archaeon]|nr:hypothetical protein [Desulfurococcales archaeon]